MGEEAVRKELNSRYGRSTDKIVEEFQNAYLDKKLAKLLYIIPLENGGFTRFGLINTENGMFKSLLESDVTVYNYLVSYQMPYFGGVSMYHSSDIGFWFDNVDKINYMVAGDEENAQSVSNAMAAGLGAFAKSSNPSSSDLEWDPYTKDSNTTMMFDVKPEQKEKFDLALYQALFNQ